MFNIVSFHDPKHEKYEDSDDSEIDYSQFNNLSIDDDNSTTTNDD